MLNCIISALPKKKKNTSGEIILSNLVYCFSFFSVPHCRSVLWTSVSPSSNS